MISNLTLLVLSCKRENTPNNNNGTGGFSPQPESNTLRAVFIKSHELDVLPYGTQYLTVFEPNGTVRWKKTIKSSNGQDDYIPYGNGMIYNSEPIGTTGPTTQDLTAYDINTGAEVWSIKNSSEKKYYLNLRNDTLFCSSSFTYPGLGNIAAFNARTGALFWRKQLNYPYWPVFLKLDGNTLFFIVTLSGTDSRVISFNINTRTVNWESASLGINLSSAFSKIALSSSRVAVKNGTKLLVVFDRNTGALVWTKPGIPFEPPIIHDNKVFTYCYRDSRYPLPNDSLLGIYAFDVNTGNRLWHWKKDISFSITNPFASGNMVFHCGAMRDGTNLPDKGYLKGFDLATGNEIWNVATPVTTEGLCHFVGCVGNEVYAFKYPPATGVPGLFARIVRYDYSTGQTKDSIMIPGTSFGRMHLVGSNGQIYSPETW